MPERRRKRIDRLFFAAAISVVVAFAGYVLLGPKPFEPPNPSAATVKTVSPG